MYSKLFYSTIVGIFIMLFCSLSYAQIPALKDCGGTGAPPTFVATCGHPTNWAYITGVRTTGGITNITNDNTNCGNTTTSYSDYTGTSMKVTQDAGKSVDVNIGWIGNNNGGSIQITSTLTKIYVDWNRDGKFDGPDEYIAPPPFQGTNPHVHGTGGITITVPVPGHAKDGLTRMRIITSANNYIASSTSNVDQCKGEFGEAEDYVFEVINPCLPPAVISIANVDFKSGDFSWTPKLNAEFYEYVITTVDTIPHDTVIGFTFTTNNNVDVDTFECETKYYILVRSICDTVNKSGAIDWDKSAWIRDSFTTNPCCYQPKVTFDRVTHNTARIKWDPIATAYGYEYGVSTIVNKPPQNAHNTINTSVLLQGLNPRTTYYVYVRSRCSPTPLSEWSQVSFKTDGPVSVNDITTHDFDMTVYPNPAKDIIYIELDSKRGDNGIVTLSDMTGKVIYHIPADADKLEIATTQLAAGMYIIRYADDVHSHVMRVTKE